MNDTPERDEILDRLLLGSGMEPVPDEGFSDHLMSMLPARRQRPPRTVLGIATGIGTVLAAWQLSGSALLHASATEMQNGIPGIAAIAVLATVLTLGAGLTGWALVEE
jgi:hypothetical protein